MHLFISGIYVHYYYVLYTELAKEQNVASGIIRVIGKSLSELSEYIVQCMHARPLGYCKSILIVLYYATLTLLHSPWVF